MQFGRRKSSLVLNLDNNQLMAVDIRTTGESYSSPDHYAAAQHVY